MDPTPADASSTTIEDLLREDRVFPPSAEFTAAANVKDASYWPDNEDARLKFWADRARELVWDEPFTKVLDWKPPHAKWFEDGKLNASVQCLDRHLGTPTANKAALVFVGEPGDKRTLTYRELYREVCRFANGLRELGVGEGDRVALYMPTIPESVAAMLACARLGAIHTVVFAGFSTKSLSERILDAQAKVVITTDHGWRRGKTMALKTAVDESVDICTAEGFKVEHVVVVKRVGEPCEMTEGRDVWYHDLIAKQPAHCEPASVGAEHPLFILYTSGTTGKPKGIFHTTGGYMTHARSSMLQVFDLKPEDVYWCTADIGWITGHTYVTYGPLAAGATQVIYDGAPDAPDKDRFWQIVQENDVSIFYTAPTAIRAFMKWGDKYPQSCDLSSLRMLGTVGEPINPEAWIWYHEVIGGGRCPIVDTWWQTETGGIMISPVPGVTATKPGSATRVLPGICADIVDDGGNPVEKGGGVLVLTRPWPSMLRGIWGDMDRYTTTYWERFGPEVYVAGDSAKRDDEGYYWLLGRIDDVLNPSGHRIGTAEIESALVSHPSVAESAVVGRPHEIKGDAIAAFVVLRGGIDSSDELVQELRVHVGDQIGKIARPDDLHICADLPKTRSGKIMRRLLRDIASGKTMGDTTTLADPSVIDALQQQYASTDG